MGKSTKRHLTEIRFSPLSLLCLFFVWVGISGLVFYVGVLVGRMEQMREIRVEYRADESAVAGEELPVLSFEESLTAPDGREGVESVSATPEIRAPEALSKPPAEAPTPGGAVLQIASFREPDRAEHLVREMRKKGYRCFQSASDSSQASGGYCRVFLGPLPSIERAAEVKEHLEREEGYKGILIRTVGKEGAF